MNTARKAVNQGPSFEQFEQVYTQYQPRRFSKDGLRELWQMHDLSGDDVLVDLERGYDPFGDWHEYKSEQEILRMFKQTHTIRDVLRQARGTISLPSGAYVLSFEETE
jgi:hypothetical protein